MHRVPALVVVALVFAVGCVNNPLQTASLGGPATKGAATGVLAAASKPAGELTAPTFKLLGAIAKGTPLLAMGEPSISAAPDGTLYVSFPGCEKFIEAGLPPKVSRCAHGLVYKSVDSGKSWHRLNSADLGKLANETPDANNDADLAVDSAGSVYVSNLESDTIQTQRSDDGGAKWTYTGNVVPEKDTGTDRNWLAAAGAGHVIHNWMGGNADHPRAVGVRTTFDGGRNWTNVTYLGKGIGWEGGAQFAPDGATAYIPFTLAQGGNEEIPLVAGSHAFSLQVGKTSDGGLTWSILDTGVKISTALASFHFSGMILAPSLAVTGDGHVVYVYAEEVPSPGGVGDVGAIVKVITSADGGVTWSKPFVVSKGPTAIFPWASGGAGDRVGLSYFVSDLPGDPDRTGRWDLHAGILDVAGESPKYVDTTVEKDIHLGGICGSGSVCFRTGGDRSLLDYFENAVTPDGRLVIVYPADPIGGGKAVEIRVALQEGGSAMLG